MHRYLLHNDDIRDTAETLLSPGQIGFLNGWGVFSTLRVAGGVLFEFERHYARMRYDAVRLRVPFEISPGALRKSLLALVDANGASRCYAARRHHTQQGRIFSKARDSRAIAM